MRSKSVSAYVVVLLLWFAAAQKDSCNLCLNGSVYKDEPSQEVGGLFNKCSAFQSRSCCTNETAFKMHGEGPGALYNLAYNHCPAEKNMSAKCRERFLEQDCFFHCSPNMGPWIENLPNSTTQKARYIPLLPEACAAWYNDCKDDYTCTGDWANGWDWSTGTNLCKEGSVCKKFSKYFSNATMLCENLYPKDYKVVESGQAGMVLWFDSAINPNDKVAAEYAKEKGLRCHAAKLRFGEFFLLLTATFAVLTYNV